MTEVYQIESNYYDDRYIASYITASRKRIEQLVPLIDLKKSNVVADFACGGGVLAELIHDKVYSYNGVDFSEKFINIAKRLSYPNVTFECSDIVCYCRKNPGRYDVAFTFDFSEHINDVEFVRIYSGIVKSLRDGGKLYLHTPNGAYFVELLKKWNILKQFPEHIAVRRAVQYKEMLLALGFDHVMAYYIPHYLPPMSYFHYLSRMPVIGEFFAARLLIVCEKPKNGLNDAQGGT